MTTVGYRERKGEMPGDALNCQKMPGAGARWSCGRPHPHGTEQPPAAALPKDCKRVSETHVTDWVVYGDGRRECRLCKRGADRDRYARTASAIVAASETRVRRLARAA